jgi:adenylate cyclase
MNERTQRRLAALVAADMVGYSRLMGIDEEGTLAALRLHRTSLVDNKISEHGGRIVKTMGDGLLIEYPSVVDAVRSAIAVQEGMRVRNVDTPPEKQIVFRIGINLGDIIIEGDDILGDGVNIAARLEALAEPGGICISQRVYEDVRDRLEIAFVDLGDRDLKNISRPVQCWAWQRKHKDRAPVKSAAQITSEPALAVLPFNNFSSDPEYEFFADGLSEDLTTLLSAYREFPVIARNSAFTFKGKDIDIIDAGKQLGASYVVEGSVRVTGKRMRVNAQLIDVETGHHLWAQKFDRDIEDIFTLQDELSLQIASNISPTVGRNENTRLGAASPGDISFWGALNKVRQLVTTFTNRSADEAREILLELEKQNPNNSMVQAFLALCVNISILSGQTRWRQGRTELMRYARRAIEIDPTNPVGYHWLSCAEQYYGHLEAALEAAERSIELNPSASQGYFWRGTNKMLLGRAEESLDDFAMIERLSPLDPLLPLKNVAKARSLLILQRYEEAVEVARMAVAISQDIAFHRILLIAALALSGRIERARQEAESYREKFPDVNLSDVLVNFTTRDPLDLARIKEGLRKVQLIEE